MASPVSSQPPTTNEGRRTQVRPHPEDLQNAIAGVRDGQEGRLLTLTPSDLEHWEKTGEWPEFLS